MVYFLSAFAVICVVAFLIAIYELKHAKEVDSKEPFIYGDYDPNKDPTLSKEDK